MKLFLSNKFEQNKLIILMGKGYSKEEMAEFQQYKATIDNALNDKGTYIQFKQTEKLLREKITKNWTNSERFTVDYIKDVIKSNNASEH